MLLRFFGFVAVAVGLLSGCSSGPKLVPVEGTVKLDGKPLANKSLSFAPEVSGGISGGGNTDSSGKYKVLAVVPGTTTDQPGLPAGKYKVTVFEPLIPIDAKVDEGTDSNPGPGLVPGAMKRSTIPMIYQNASTTPLVIEVKDGGAPIDLELKASGG